jgi:hypothetical protein
MFNEPEFTFLISISSRKENTRGAFIEIGTSLNFKVLYEKGNED